MALIHHVAFALAMTSLPVYATDNNFGDAGGVLKEETRVYLGECFFSDIVVAPPKTPVPQFALGPVLGVALGEAVVDFTVGALKAAGEDKSIQAIAAYSANGWMYQLDTNARLVVNPKGRCIQVISGSFWNGLRALGPESIDNVPTRDPSKTVKLDNREPVKTKDPSGVDVTVVGWKPSEPLVAQLEAYFRQLRQARFFFEARIEPLQGTDDKFVIAPNAMYFEKPVERGIFEISPKRNVLVSLTMANSGADTSKAFASINFPFRDVPSDTLLTPLYFRDQTSRAIQVPELTDDEKKSVLAKKAKLEKAVSEVEITKGPTPQTEFEPPNSFTNASYQKAAKSYCDELDKYNATLTSKNKNATKITAPECPVDLQVAKAKLSKANSDFIKYAAKQEAEFNTNHYWLLPKGDPQSHGVTCSPKNDKNTDFEANCALTSTTDVRSITVAASVVEVKEGNQFAAFMGKVLEKAQPGINAEIEAATPEKQTAAAEQHKADLDAYQLALADVATAEAGLADVSSKSGATATEMAKAERDLLEKKIAANQKARKAGLAEKYQIP